MKAKFSNYYRKGLNLVFVYLVTCTAEEKEAFKKAKGAYYREDENGNPLFYASRPLTNNRNESVKLDITQNGNIVVDDSDSVFDQEVKLQDCIIQEKAKIMAQQALHVGGMQAVSRLTQTSQRTPVDANIPEIEDEAIFGPENQQQPVQVENQPLNV